MKQFTQEFKTFIIKGNAIDLAVGVVIGVAFNNVVNSLVKDIILGFIATVAKVPDLSAFSYGAIMWGSFLNTLINLIIIGFSVFMTIKVINKLAGKQFVNTETPAK